jgi:hypothetical protein
MSILCSKWSGSTYAKPWMTVLIVGASASVVMIQRMLLFVVIWVELKDEFVIGNRRGRV